jgi:hypothetical protein
MKKITSSVLAVALSLIVTALFSLSCSTPSEQRVETSPAQMWSDNCSRCHVVRDPGSLSDSEWGVAMRHMKIRGGLTEEEHDGILAFLRASN